MTNQIVSDSAVEIEPESGKNGGTPEKTVQLDICVKVREENNEPELFVVRSLENVNPGAKPKQISNVSPFGKALMYRSVGDLVEVRSPGGTFKLRILEIGGGINCNGGKDIDELPLAA